MGNRNMVCGVRWKMGMTLTLPLGRPCGQPGWLLQPGMVPFRRAAQVLVTRESCAHSKPGLPHGVGCGKRGRMTRHCWKCGWEWSHGILPGRSESCSKCFTDLRVCLNCVAYDPRSAHQCRDRRADPVVDKHVGNFCEYFEWARRVYKPPASLNPREDAAREQLKKLFGD